MRLGQGVGGAFLFANSSAILTDAFPENERGLALGINGVAAIGGSFIGLILGGVLAPIEWHLVFVVSAPLGCFRHGLVAAQAARQRRAHEEPHRLDRQRPVRASGLVGVLTGIVYGLNPYGGHTMGWTKPFVLACLLGGAGGAGRCSWSSSCGWPTRCSGWTSSASAPSAWATSPPCSPPSPAVACSSC